MRYIDVRNWCSVVPFVPLDDQPGADLGPLVFPEATHLVYILMQSGVGEGATSVPPQPYCTEYGSYCATKNGFSGKYFRVNSPLPFLPCLLIPDMSNLMD